MLCSFTNFQLPFFFVFFLGYKECLSLGISSITKFKHDHISEKDQFNHHHQSLVLCQSLMNEPWKIINLINK